MRYGHSIGYDFYGLDWLIVILIIAFIALYVLISINKNNLSSSYSKFLNMLNERYARGELDSDEYNERKIIIEDSKSTEPAILILLERFAKGEIDSKEFYVIKNDIENKALKGDVYYEQ